MLKVNAAVCLRKLVIVTVAGRCGRGTQSEITAAEYQTY